MATLGRIEQFNRESDDWPQYVERLNFYFEANAINAAAKKRAAFLTLVGPEVYKTLRSLVAPQKPNEKTYDELIEVLTNHFSPKRSQVLYRTKFHNCVRKRGDSIASFLAELRALADYCSFGDTLQVMLRDRLVCGVNDPDIQKKLLIEGDDLTLERAVSIAQSLESANRDIHELSPPLSPQVESPTVQVVTMKNKSAHKNPPVSVKPSTPCFRCARVGHSPETCYYRDKVCFNCHKVGHIRPACRSRPVTGQWKTNSNPPVHSIAESGSEDSEYSLMTINSVSSNKPMIISVVVDGSPLDMELDTGAAVSLISEERFKQLWPKKPLQDSSTTLKTYSGEALSVQGTIQVVVEYNQQHASLPLFVVKGNGPSLFGREWLNKITLDWKAINRVQLQAVDELIHSFLEMIWEGCITSRLKFM